ncbi:hypothetical protein ACQR3Q_02770 [Dietzia natronolimnaea]
MTLFLYETALSQEQRSGRTVLIDADSMDCAREVGTTVSRLREPA